MRSEALVVGIDIGTSSAKGVLVDRQGRVRARASRAHAVSRPGPGMVEQDAEAVWWRGFTVVAADLVAQAGVDPGEIACLAISAIGQCVLPVDEKLKPLRPGILYGIDARAEPYLEELMTRFAAGGDPVTLTTQSVVPKLVWLARNEPQLWARTAAVLGAEGYVVGRLTGRLVLDRYDAGGYAPMLSDDGRGWRADFADICPPSRLPDLAWPSELVGKVTEEGAQASGLAPGTAVMCGLVDAAAEAIGVGALEVGDMLVMLGSTGFFITQLDRPLVDHRLWHAPGFEPGRYVLAGGMNTVGTLVDWAAQLLAPGVPTDRAIEQLGGAAVASGPGARGLTMLPYFEGERTPVADPGARGAILGLTSRHGAGDLVRAAFEAIAYGIRDNLAAMEQAGAKVTQLKASGGLARSRPLLQIIADITGMPLLAPGHDLGAPFGNAVRAAVGAGWFTSMRQACEAWSPPVQVLQPDRSLAAFFDKGLDRYRALYDVTRPLLEQ